MESRRKEILRLCRAVLGGEIGIIEGSRLLSKYATDVSEKHDSDFIIFVGIDSETDHLPIGSTRKLWSNSVLVEKDKEIKNSRTSGRKKCLRLAR